MTKIVNEIGSNPIGGKIEGTGDGMTIDEIVNSLYRLSEDLQCPIYFGKGPVLSDGETPDSSNIPAGALRVKIS